MCLVCAVFGAEALTLTISPPSTSISPCRFWSSSSGLDLQFNKPSRSTGQHQHTRDDRISTLSMNTYSNNVKSVTFEAVVET